MQAIDDTTLQRINTGVLLPDGLLASVNAMQEIAKKLVETYVEPMRRIAEIVQEGMKKILESFKQVFETVAQSIRCLMSWRPLIYVTPPTTVDKRLDRHLTVSISTHGYFVLGGKTIFRLHSRTSRVGRFLHCLLLAMSEVVTYEEIEEHIGAGDRQKAFKDLKYKLRQEGYELDYTLVRTEGIALNGVLAID